MRDVCFTFEADDNFIGKAIRWFTDSDVNHVAAEFGSIDWEATWVVEAIPKGTVCRPSRNRKWTYIVTPKYDAREHIRAAQDFVDRKYEFKAIFLFAIFILAWRWFRLKWHKPFLKGKDQICSELVSHMVLPVLGPVIEDPQWTDPGKLLRIFQAYPKHYNVRKMDVDE